MNTLLNKTVTTFTDHSSFKAPSSSPCNSMGAESRSVCLVDCSESVKEQGSDFISHKSPHEFRSNRTIRSQHSRRKQLVKAQFAMRADVSTPQGVHPAKISSKHSPLLGLKESYGMITLRNGSQSQPVLRESL